jgi:CheY-like chemotaxis protein
MQSMFNVMVPHSPHCEVMFANDGAQALKIVASVEPDLIFLDINMPVMDGLKCLRVLREMGVSQRRPVVIVSTEGSEDDIARAKAAGAREYVTKPFKRREVVAIIEKYLPAALGL